jgi:hypothetical protein
MDEGYSEHYLIVAWVMWLALGRIWKYIYIGRLSQNDNNMKRSLI